MSIEKLIKFEEKIHVADLGAAAIYGAPPYKPLFDHSLARLSAVDGDVRKRDDMVRAFGPDTRVLTDIIGDGKPHKMYLSHPQNGMSSILAPSARFDIFNALNLTEGRKAIEEGEMRRLGDIDELQGIDFLKMDLQGAELMVLQNAGTALDMCVAIQCEASFIPLYEGQPAFGEIDQWMRANGFLPHCFVEVKPWSIAPTIRNDDFRMPFNQLLECDVVYVRGLVELGGLSDAQLKKLILIALYCYGSPDLAVHAEQELERRGTLPNGTLGELVKLANPELTQHPV